MARTVDACRFDSMHRFAIPVPRSTLRPRRGRRRSVDPVHRPDNGSHGTKVSTRLVPHRVAARQRCHPDPALDRRRSGAFLGARPHLAARLTQANSGALVRFTDWRGDPDQRLTDDGLTVAQVTSATTRGALVRVLL